MGTVPLNRPVVAFDASTLAGCGATTTLPRRPTTTASAGRGRTRRASRGGRRSSTARSRSSPSAAPRGRRCAASPARSACRTRPCCTTSTRASSCSSPCTTTPIASGRRSPRHPPSPPSPTRRPTTPRCRASSSSTTTLVAASLKDDSATARAYFTERFSRLRGELAERLRTEQADGRVRADIDPDRIAALLIAASDGLQVQWLLDPSMPLADVLGALGGLLAPPR